ncbi:MAG: hypothetical protein HRF45_02020 [Fimbriimonadia bacterium]|jgi:exopolyphosphatase/guanosine-5'-triphosphate,3'-diphosphate pyrophosphatase
MPQEGTRRAVFDIGSSSVLLLVAEFRGGQWHRVVERCVVTHLGEGLAETDALSEAAMERTTQACTTLLQEALVLEPEIVSAVGTMALRIASNSHEMLDRLARIGLEVRVLQPREEGRLSYLSVSRDPLLAGPMGAVVDIGGASTEICSVSAEYSYPIGASMLAAGLLGSGPCPGRLVHAAGEAADVLFASEPPGQASPIATVGSTGVNLASISRGVGFDPDAVHGWVLALEHVQRLRKMLCDMSADERATIPGLEAGREVAIHAGALILERAMAALGALEVQVSSRGLRWALLDGLAESGR